LPEEIQSSLKGNEHIEQKVLAGGIDNIFVSFVTEITRKKQERSMITAYDAYIEKRDKAKVSRKKGDPNDPAAAVELSLISLTIKLFTQPYRETLNCKTYPRICRFIFRNLR
jgi:hypothetical protein